MLTSKPKVGDRALIVYGRNKLKDLDDCEVVKVGLKYLTVKYLNEDKHEQFDLDGRLKPSGGFQSDLLVLFHDREQYQECCDRKDLIWSIVTNVSADKISKFSTAKLKRICNALDLTIFD